MATPTFRAGFRHTILNGTLVAIAGQGVLLTGPPGIGKSETALDLVRNGHRLVADDLVELEPGTTATTLQGRAPKESLGFIEVRGIGILNVGALYGARATRSHASISLEVVLLPPGNNEGPDLDRIHGIADSRMINGCRIPLARLWASPGRPLATLVEALVYRLIREQAGANEVEQFMFAQTQRMTRP